MQIVESCISHRQRE